jgi:hypothetical protein
MGAISDGYALTNLGLFNLFIGNFPTIGLCSMAACIYNFRIYSDFLAK